jgi:hypothetical protein|tara:strand:+ start:222 stop:1382 length:1161 start_codon:yes stop_codon:yes gene_type:complete
MKRLVLHIGMAKTGTSSIQDTLGPAHQTLRDMQVYYPPERPYNHCYEFSVLFMQRPQNNYYFKRQAPISEREIAAQLDGLAERWRAFFQSFDRGVCILSAENLSDFQEGDIQKLQRFVSPFFDEVSIVAYVRHPISAIKSQWEQDVKELDKPQSAADILTATKRRYNYSFVHRWSKVFGNEHVTIRPFEPGAFYNGDLIDDFLHAAGIASTLGKKIDPVQSNQSLGPNGTAFLLAFNAQHPVYRQGQLNSDRGLAGQLNTFYQLMRESNTDRLTLDIHFTTEEAAAINQQIHLINQFIAESDQFDEVQADTKETLLPDPQQIPVSYFVELVNRYAQRVDHLNDKLARQHETILRLEKEMGNNRGIFQSLYGALKRFYRSQKDSDLR